MTKEEAYKWQLDRANKAEDQLFNANKLLEVYRENVQKSTDAMVLASVEITRLRQQVKKQRELIAILSAKMQN